MEFMTTDRTYTVIQMMNNTNDYKIYLAYEGKKKYILLSIESEDLKKNVGIMLYEYFENSKSTDFREVFIDGNKMIFVFKASDLYTNLFKMNEEDIPFENKLEYVYKVLAAFCIFELPYCMAIDLLENGNVGMDLEENPRCFYNLACVEKYEKINSMSSFLESLKNYLNTIWKTERKQSHFKECKKFLTELDDNPPNDFLELYDRYQLLYDEYKRKMQEGIFLKQDGNRSYKKKLVTVIKVLKKVLIILIIFLAIFVLIKTFNYKKAGKGGIYESIGEVKIEEYGK